MIKFNNILQANTNANKSRQILSLSLVALLGAVALGTGPAFAADGMHCVHTIDYNKLSANELKMINHDIDVPQFANDAATGGKCVATIDYNKLSANELEMINHDIDVPQFANDGATMGKYLAAIDYTKLSVVELDKANQGVDFTIVYRDVVGNEKDMTARTDR
jgi:hypothetical protein